MKTIIITVCIILSGTVLYAQKNSSMFELSINGGVGSPSGNFAKGKYDDQTSGFAKTGAHFNVTGTFLIHKSFGITVFAGYTQFGYKGALSLAEGYKEDSGTDSTTLYLKGHNHALSILAGPAFSFPLSKKMQLDLRALGGYVNTNLAGFRIYYEDVLDNSLAQIQSSASAFGYQLGAGLKYKLGDKVSLKLNADYFSSNPKMKIAYQNFVVNSGRRLSQYKETITGVNGTLGLAFDL